MSFNMTFEAENSTLTLDETMKEERPAFQAWIAVALLFSVMVLVTFAGSVCILGGFRELFPCCGRVQQQGLTNDREEIEMRTVDDSCRNVLFDILPNEKDRRAFLEFIVPSKLVTKDMLATMVTVDKQQDAASSCTSSGPNIGGSLKGDTSCAICLADYKEGELISELSGTPTRPGCGHAFHKTCIEEWAEASASVCPICRQDIFSLDEAIAFGRSRVHNHKD